jgi:hypothetical protein
MPLLLLVMLVWLAIATGILHFLDEVLKQSLVPKMTMVRGVIVRKSLERVYQAGKWQLRY